MRRGDFFEPADDEGRKRREEARLTSHPNYQRAYISSKESRSDTLKQSSEAAAWQLRHGDDMLSNFAAGEISKCIDRLEDDRGDPSGSYGEILSRVCGLLDIDLGDLIAARGDRKRIIAIARAKLGSHEESDDRRSGGRPQRRGSRSIRGRNR